jgi:hypothetical protein
VITVRRGIHRFKRRNWRSRVLPWEARPDLRPDLAFRSPCRRVSRRLERFPPMWHSGRGTPGSVGERLSVDRRLLIRRYMDEADSGEPTGEPTVGVVGSAVPDGLAALGRANGIPDLDAETSSAFPYPAQASAPNLTRLRERVDARLRHSQAGWTVALITGSGLAAGWLVAHLA